MKRKASEAAKTVRGRRYEYMGDGRYIVRNERSEPALRALVSLRHEITRYVDRDGDIVTVLDTEDAGSSFTFLLRAWLSLHDGRPLDLRGVQLLDTTSMAAFQAMLRAYWRPEEW